MALESIHNIFPLIDDPANIFYSKIKQWFQIQSNFHLHCKATSRVERIVEAKFMGISRTYTCSFNTVATLKEEDIDNYLYIRYTFVESHKDNFELTTSGEHIPVDISDLYILENSPKPFVLVNQDNTVLFERDPDNHDKPHYFVYIRVGKVYRNEYSQLDIKNTEFCYSELHFEDAYRPSIGRLWVLSKRSSALTTKQSVLDNNYDWKLYNIDSDNNYTLIDSSDSLPTSFGATIIWPAQYGPGLDHKTSFVINTKGYHEKEPPSDLISGYSYWTEIIEAPFYKGNYHSFIYLNDKAEPYLNTRGIVPAFFPYLFNGIVLQDDREYWSFSHIYNIESLLNAISYICNMNLRYILCGLNEKPMNQVVIPQGTDTPESLLSGSERDNYSLKSVYTVEFRNYSEVSQADFVRYTDNSATSNAPNKDKVVTTNLGNRITHNSLPTPIFPNVRWYYHQWIYALSFKKYAPFYRSSDGVEFIASSNLSKAVLTQSFINTNLVFH